MTVHAPSTTDQSARRRTGGRGHKVDCLPTVACIFRFQQRHQRPPTHREVMRELGLSSTAMVFVRVARAVEQGYLTKAENTARGVRITDAGREALITAELI